MLSLAHGVGRVYESPIPVSYYLLGAALTVLASFLIRAFLKEDRPHPQRLIAGKRAKSVAFSTIRVYLLAVFGLILIFAFVYADEPGTLGIAALMFWVAFVITTVVLTCIFSGIWPQASPVETIDRMMRPEPEAEEGARRVPVWLPPVAIYLLFWFELVSDRGFEPLWILGVALGYSVYVIAVKPLFGRETSNAEPFGILFGFAQRIAPLRLREEGVEYRGFTSGLDESRPMPSGLFAALFVLLASTTLDNARETAQWFDLLDVIGLDSLDSMIVDSLALLLLTIPFALPFLLAVRVPHRFAPGNQSFMAVARSFGWSLIPIGIAYVLAHNVTLLIVGFPNLVNQLTEGFGIRPFGNYSPSPLLAWILEIGLIVGGHVIGVMAAHRTAVRVTGSHQSALKSHVALTLLMSLYTVTTLWLLSLPLVTA